MVIDRAVWRRTGATALYRNEKGWETVVAYPPGYDRPWARTNGEGATTRASGDASPNGEDLAPED
jgi:hypothetical protein